MLPLGFTRLRGDQAAGWDAAGASRDKHSPSIRADPAVTDGASTGRKNGTRTAPGSVYTVLYPFGFPVEINRFPSKAHVGVKQLGGTSVTGTCKDVLPASGSPLLFFFLSKILKVKEGLLEHQACFRHRDLGDSEPQLRILDPFWGFEAGASFMCAEVLPHRSDVDGKLATALACQRCCFLVGSRAQPWPLLNASNQTQT